mmetsp:Transcript_21820/g.46392  ORF Transcript_21820/g.46392 Transcript_21820/m.46392 type:complete len:220 (+) Transcript_21820:147-806(+)
MSRSRRLRWLRRPRPQRVCLPALCGLHWESSAPNWRRAWQLEPPTLSLPVQVPAPAARRTPRRMPERHARWVSWRPTLTALLRSPGAHPWQRHLTCGERSAGMSKAPRSCRGPYCARWPSSSYGAPCRTMQWPWCHRLMRRCAPPRRCWPQSPMRSGSYRCPALGRGAWSSRALGSWLPCGSLASMRRAPRTGANGTNSSRPSRTPCRQSVTLLTTHRC